MWVLVRACLNENIAHLLSDYLVRFENHAVFLHPFAGNILS